MEELQKISKGLELLTWETWVCSRPAPIQATSDYVLQGKPSVVLREAREVGQVGE
jgi:hypothetical protein